jgi:hypothetical protein
MKIIFLLLSFLLIGCELKMDYCSNEGYCEKVISIGEQSKRPSWEDL